MTLVGALVKHAGHRLESQTTRVVPEGRVFGAPHVVLYCWTCDKKIHDEALEVRGART